MPIFYRKKNQCFICKGFRETTAITEFKKGKPKSVYICQDCCDIIVDIETTKEGFNELMEGQQ